MASRLRRWYQVKAMAPMLTAAMFYAMCNAFSRCCPPDSVTMPCRCSGPNTFTVLTCDGLISTRQVERVASRLASHTLDYGKFSMSNAKVMKLERGMFGDLRFEYIQVKKSTVVQVDDGALEPSRDTLRRLEVVHCELKSFPFQNVSTFPKLESLSLQYNNLKAVPDYAFRYNPGLKKVDLSFNKIAYVGNYAFYYVPFLEELNLRNNKLKVLNNNAFAVHVKPNNDMVLDLSHNQIVLIAENAFHNENFRLLNMSHNRLRSFPEKHFRPLLVRMAVQLEGTIDVEGNRMNCTCDSLQWLLRMQPYYRRFVKGFVCAETHKTLEHMTTWDLDCAHGGQQDDEQRPYLRRA
ncbi:leucine-rich repeat-containing protein 4B-like isoform X1 [Dermacentor albipictus]|uniref:leucine-rich repeat-containing protein 4B-like isoform X1 n=2 Tax=Dermacentor albipictus TaxID=60249 RepID=UPI0031FE3062